MLGFQYSVFFVYWCCTTEIYVFCLMIFRKYKITT
jgi:hypothetical protein